jgi:acyl-CoA thioesterase
MSQLTPQALAEACAQALLENDEATNFLDMMLGNVEPGKCSISMIVKNTMCNGHGTCHGGYIFTLADSAFAFACNTYNQRAVAQHCNITYLNPAASGERLTATAIETSKQGRGGIYDVRVHNQTGHVIAEFRGHSRTIKGTLLPEA